MKPVLILFFLVFFSCCKRDVPPEPEIVSSLDSESVLVLNEGNFNWGNASIDMYFPNIKEYSLGIFESSNDRPLGDVLQSGKIINGQLWLVLNNSGKIEVIDTSSFKTIKTITGLTSPRHMYFHSGKVYVTDLYSETVAVINSEDYSLQNPISISGWTEQIEGVGNQFYCINKDSNQLLTHIIASNSTSSVNISGKPFDLKKASNSVFCFSYSIDTLFVLNTTLTKVDTFAGILSNVPNRAVYCEANQNWYFTAGNELLRLKNNTLEKVFELSSGSLYAAECIGDEFYISNAKDYVANSELTRISLDGVEIDKRTTGKITNGFLKIN